MNNNKYFAQNPTGIDIQRSKFDRPSQHKTTMNAGDLVPIYLDEILPGDTVHMDMSALIRMSTPIFPIMDNAYVEFFWFFVPNRLVWNHWKEFMGENTESYWAQQTEYELPQLKFNTTKEGSGPAEKGSIADYMGIPTKINGLSVTALPFRAYCLIWNEWFRSENVQQPVEVNMGDTDTYYTIMANNANYSDVTGAQTGAKLLRSNKPFDYFTAALPQPQKGAAVLLPLGLTAPVIGNGNAIAMKAKDARTMYGYTENIAATTDGTQKRTVMTYRTEGGEVGTPGKGYEYTDAVNGYIGLATEGDTGLVTDLQSATAATVNQLRQAFAIQRMLERDARGGSRYTEVIRAHFGVISPDARQQRPEYLGGCKRMINVDQVIQTSSTDTTTPQGNTAAYSVTGIKDNKFTKSFTEHGILMCLATIRTDHTYQQGLERFWNRKKRTDFYFPALANIGEQAILNKEIYAQGTEADNEAFGYQEAWADYRYKPSRVSSAMRSNYKTTLDSWHYADYYEALPTLTSKWMEETRVNVDRTIAVSEQLEDQFICDFYFNCTMTRPMPLYSIPGLIDHH